MFNKYKLAAERYCKFYFRELRVNKELEEENRLLKKAHEETQGALNEVIKTNKRLTGVTIPVLELSRNRFRDQRDDALRGIKGYTLPERHAIINEVMG